MTPPLATCLVLVLVGVALLVPRTLRRRGLPAPITRWIAALTGGLGYYVAVRWLSASTAIALSSLAVLLIVQLRARRSSLLAGLRSSDRDESRAELGYPSASTVALIVGWALLHDPWFAFLAIALMAFGDASAGLVRGFVAPSARQTAVAAAAMLAASLASAWLFYPSAVGVAAALAATLAEAAWPLTRSRVSDNWPVVGSALPTAVFLGGNI